MDSTQSASAKQEQTPNYLSVKTKKRAPKQLVKADARSAQLKISEFQADGEDESYSALSSRSFLSSSRSCQRLEESSCSNSHRLDGASSSFLSKGDDKMSCVNFMERPSVAVKVVSSETNASSGSPTAETNLYKPHGLQLNSPGIRSRQGGLLQLEGILDSSSTMQVDQQDQGPLSPTTVLTSTGHPKTWSSLFTPAHEPAAMHLDCFHPNVVSSPRL